MSGGGIDQAIKLPPATLSRTYGALVVTAFDPHPASNGLYFSDEGTVAGALGPVADDFLSPSGPDIHVSISGLAAGLYSMTTYHHRPLAASANPIVAITVDTGAGPQTVASNVPISVGLAPSSVSSATFQFTADGANDVEIAVQGGALSFPLPLNGFSLSLVPEPTGAILLAIGGGLGGCACLGRKLRRRRTALSAPGRAGVR
jgi:hypothetical protein